MQGSRRSAKHVRPAAAPGAPTPTGRARGARRAAPGARAPSRAEPAVPARRCGTATSTTPGRGRARPSSTSAASPVRQAPSTGVQDRGPGALPVRDGRRVCDGDARRHPLPAAGLEPPLPHVLAQAGRQRLGPARTRSCSSSSCRQSGGASGAGRSCRDERPRRHGASRRGSADGRPVQHPRSTSPAARRWGCAQNVGRAAQGAPAGPSRRGGGTRRAARRGRGGRARGGPARRRAADELGLGLVAGLEVLAPHLAAALHEHAGDDDVEALLAARGVQSGRSTYSVPKSVSRVRRPSIARTSSNRLVPQKVTVTEVGVCEVRMRTPLRAVVLEDQVGLGEADGRLATRRVPADPVAVRGVLDVLEPAEEDGVERRGRELRDAAADRVDELALEDLRRLDEAAGLVARTDVGVEVEALAGPQRRGRRRCRRCAGCW